MRAFTSLLSVALVVASIATPASAQERFPSQPIRMIVPAAAGGGSDITFRQLATLAEPFLGTSIVILNRPGGNGAVALNALLASKPDGYTVAGVYGDILTVAPHMTNVPYSPADFVGISQSVSVPLVFCVKPGFPANNGEEFLAALRAKPDEYTYGADGAGGAVHLAAERIFKRAGVKARMIPYSDSGKILQSFLGDNITIYGGVIGNVKGSAQSGAAKCLLVSSAERSPTLPQATGLKELQLEDSATVVWRGVIGIKGTPEDRVRILESAFIKAAQSDRFKEFMDQQGGVAVGGPGADLNQIMQRDYAAFGRLVKELKLENK